MSKLNNIRNFKHIDDFVEKKLDEIRNSPKDFKNFFEIMFKEKENIMYERSEGLRIIKTTYKEGYDNILSLSSSLKEILKDIPIGSCVGLNMANSIRFIELFWSILRCGYSVVLINSLLDDTSINNLLDESNTKIVITDQREFKIKTINENEITYSKQKEFTNDFGQYIYVMSSGTSLSPKLCAYSAEEFYQTVEYSGLIIKESKLIKKHYNGELKHLTFLPFYHIFGLVAVYIWFAFFSRTFVELKDYSPNTITSTIQRHEITHIFAVPLFWEKVYETALKTIKDKGKEKVFNKALKLSLRLNSKLFKKIAFKEVRDNMFGESICFMVTGGSFIKKEILEFFNGIGYYLVNGYGTSEIGITSVELSLNPKYINNASIGKPMKGIEYRINDENELEVKGLSVSKYIIENGEKKERSTWFNTHDLCEKKKDRYYILGRKDDLVISRSGENLNPNIIENKVIVKGIEKTCLLNLDGQATLVCFVDKNINSKKLEKIDKELKHKIKSENYSKEISSIIYSVDTFMNDGEIKVNRKRILNKLKNSSLKLVTIDSIDDIKIENDLYKKIKEIYLSALDKNDVKDEADFFLDNGGTSIDYFGLLSKIEEEFNIKLPYNENNTLSSLKDIYNYIKDYYD